MKRLVSVLALTALAASFSTAASAYVGPGAGLSMLGAFWALIVALGTALFFVVAWPVRKMLRRSRNSGAAETGAATDDAQRPDAA
ncbi:hypothetical protein V6C03_10405 [Methyloligella sp. 2.7D]|uniref:hypothetical protein n=1 Tax=unclassified Methyloligella TaxID=2625955 RepID=UPI00157CBD03|nr:hypothetical protein [Methyloligella sp. GL2]QKP77755.1 hypothetical protein HT051_10050 [Methyloligella sp. GL2]